MGPNKKKEIAHDQWEVEEEDNPITTMVKVLLQEKVKELEDRIKLLVSLLESQKGEGVGLSNNLRRENHCLKEELASVKASTRKSLEQNKVDLEDMAERFFAENASIEKRLVLAEEKIRTLTEDNGKLEHESLLKESMNSELLSALNQKEEELKQVMTETIKVRSEKEECKKEIKQVMDQFTRKINQLQETNMIVEMKSTTLGEENLNYEKEREILRDANINLENKISVIQEENMESEKKINMLQEKNIKMGKDIATLQEQMFKREKETRNLQEAISKSAKEILIQRETNMKSEKEIALLREDIASKAATLENVREVKVSYRQTVGELRQKISTLTEKTDALEKKENEQVKKLEEKCSQISWLQVELEKERAAVLVKSDSEQIIQDLKSELIVLTETCEKNAMQRIGDLESLKDLEDELERVKWQNSELLEAAEVESKSTIDKMKFQIAILNDKLSKSESTVMGQLNTIQGLQFIMQQSDERYKMKLNQLSQALHEKDGLVESAQRYYEKLKSQVKQERDHREVLDGQLSTMRKEMKDYESLFVKRLAEQLSDQRETVSAKDSLLVILKREMMSKETSDIRKLRAENDLLCVEIKGYKQKISQMTEESTKNGMKMALLEAERKDQNEEHLQELKVKSQAIENLLGEKAAILLEKDSLQGQLVVLKKESSSNKVKIENLELDILQNSKRLKIKEKAEEEEKKKMLEMTSEIEGLRDENSSLHLEMNTLQERLAEQTIEVENMRKSMEQLKSQHLERESVKKVENEKEEAEKASWVRKCQKAEEEIKSLIERNARMQSEVKAFEDEVSLVKRESNLRVSKSVELLELERLMHREAELGKNKEIVEKEEEIKLLRVQKSQMQTYFLQLELKVEKREEEIKALNARWKRQHGEHGDYGEEVEERRVVYRESERLVFREVDMEERKRKRRSEDRSSFFSERQREKNNHRLY